MEGTAFALEEREVCGDGALGGEAGRFAGAGSGVEGGFEFRGAEGD